MAIAVVACWPPATATADLLITPFLGLKFGGATSFVDLDRGADNTKLTLGGALTLLDEGVLGLELDLGLTPRFFDPGTGGLTASGSVRTLTGNVLVLTPRSVTRESLRPYLVAGAGWMNVNIDDVQEVLPVDSNLLGLNVGAGALGPLTERTSLRFELRYFRNLTSDPDAITIGSARLSFWRTTLGVSIRY
ncbi:MAG: outer membrane protein [Vicinamibacterales bacterium]